MRCEGVTEDVAERPDTSEVGAAVAFEGSSRRGRIGVSSKLVVPPIACPNCAKRGACVAEADAEAEGRVRLCAIQEARRAFISTKRIRRD